MMILALRQALKAVVLALNHEHGTGGGLQVVAVACSSCLYLLSITDGSVLNSIETGDAIRGDRFS